jgi:hypothetical protein
MLFTIGLWTFLRAVVFGPATIALEDPARRSLRFPYFFSTFQSARIGLSRRPLTFLRNALFV